MAAFDDLKLNVTFDVNFQGKRNRTGLKPTLTNNQFSKLMRFVLGTTGALGVNELYAAVRTLAGGASETLDLAGSGLTNPVGDIGIAFARIKFLLVWLLAAADNIDDGTDDGIDGTAATHILIGGAASNQALLFFGDVSDKIRVNNGGVQMWADPGASGVAVTAGTVDQFKIENGDGAVSAKYLLILGGSAT